MSSQSLRAMLLLSLFVVCLSGCQSIRASKLWAKARPNPNDYRDPSDDPGSEWSFVGDEGRGDKPRDIEADDVLFKKYLMSPRARSIERNLGVD